jgi:hypothetical protein
MAAWDNIAKAENWVTSDTPISVIHCIDGDITLE